MADGTGFLEHAPDTAQPETVTHRPSPRPRLEFSTADADSDTARLSPVTGCGNFHPTKETANLHRAHTPRDRPAHNARVEGGPLSCDPRPGRGAGGRPHCDVWWRGLLSSPSRSPPGDERLAAAVQLRRAWSCLASGTWFIPTKHARLRGRCGARWAVAAGASSGRRQSFLCSPLTEAKTCLFVRMELLP